jgi:arginyl-tRNA synthetase
MEHVSKLISDAVTKLFNINDIKINISRPDQQYGDFSCNIAMQLANNLGDKPRTIAEKIADYLQQDSNIQKVDIAGPGFINIKLSDDYIYNLFNNKPEQIYHNKIVITEYSDPNAFKALHAGHLYTTLVGNAIANIIEATGGKVYRLNYGGDVGLHAAKAMWGIINYLGGEKPDELSKVDKSERPAWVSQRYVEGNTAYEDNPEHQQQIADINKQIYQLHDNLDKTSNFAKIYWACREWSYDGFKQMYQDLSVHAFDEFIPESLVTPLGQQTVEQGLKNNVFEESDGAIVYSEATSGLHTRVFITSKGLPTYEAKELGLAMYKWQKYHFDKSLVITANDIIEYMKVLFSAMGNFYPEVKERTTHLTHGMIKLSGGRKMSSRKGNVLMANDIIESAISANIQSSGKDDKNVAIGAIKYAFLKQRIGGDIIYDPDESISLNGNSGPYLQYAHARARNILAKVNDFKAINSVNALDENERALALKLTEYAETINKSASEFMPHHICTYLYELAVVFNRFYENSKVIGDDRQDIRLNLVKRYADTLKNGLAILGINAPNYM